MTRPPRGGSSNPGAPHLTTHGSNVTPCTGSRPGGCTSGGEVACSSPATPPTRRHRSPGRACAPACETPPTWRGSSTWCWPACSPDPLLDTYGPERAPNMQAVIELAIDMGRMVCACDPEEVRPATRCSSPPTTAASPPSRHSPASAPASSCRAHRRPAISSSKPTSRETACEPGSTTPFGAGWRLVTNGPVALDRRTRRLVRQHRRRRRGRRRHGRAHRRRWRLRHVVRRARRRRRPATARLRAVRDGRRRRPGPPTSCVPLRDALQSS